MTDKKLYQLPALNGAGANDLVYVSKPDGAADGAISFAALGSVLGGVLSPTFAAAAHRHLAGEITGLAPVATSNDYADLDNRPVLFDGAYGSLTGAPVLGTAAGLDVDVDGTLAANADSKIASQRAVKIYVDDSVAAAAPADNSITYAKIQDVSETSRLLGRKTIGAGDPEELTLSDVLDFIGAASQGDILYRAESDWSRLAAGTNGEFLKSMGAGANPVWDVVPGVSSSASQDFTDGAMVMLPVNGSATVTTLGCLATSTGLSARSMATTNAITQQCRVGVAVSTGANAVSQLRGATPACLVGTLGWTFKARFSIESTLVNSRIFVGCMNGWSATVDPSAAGSNIVGVAKDSADTNLQLIHNDAAGAATKIDLGANFPANTSGTDYYDVELVMAAGGASLDYTITRVNTGNVSMGTILSDLPAATAYMFHGCWFCTGATSGAFVGNVMRIYAKPSP